MKSILQDTKECYYTKTTLNLDRHHIMYGPFKKKSEKYGLMIYIEHRLHLYLHNNKPQKLIELKKIAQIEFEKTYGHELWMKEFKKSYLWI